MSRPRSASANYLHRDGDDDADIESGDFRLSTEDFRLGALQENFTRTSNCMLCLIVIKFNNCLLINALRRIMLSSLQLLFTNALFKQFNKTS